MATISRTNTGWRAQVRLAGHKPQSKSFDNKPDAQVWARDLEAKLDRGHSVPSGSADFTHLLQVYRAEIGDVAGTSKSFSLTAVDKIFGDTRIAKITPKTYIDFVTERERQGAGPATIQMDLSYMGTVIRHAGVLENIDTTPALVALGSARLVLRHAGRIANSDERDRRPTEYELRALENYWLLRRRKNMAPMWRIVLFAVATSMRLSEIMRLRWEDFDPKTRTILIPNRKHPTKKKTNSERVPLLEGPFTYRGNVVNPVVLVHEQAHRVGRIFPHVPDTVSAGFTRAVAALHIPDLTFHDLRHDAISRMFEYGMDIVSVALCSGHKDWKQLKRYTNIRPETLHKE